MIFIQRNVNVVLLDITYDSLEWLAVIVGISWLNTLDQGR